MSHVCHWPACPEEVPPRLWGCRRHWFTLPQILRAHILKEYQPGQEITKTPSVRYIAVALIVQAWINDYLKGDVADWNALFVRDRLSKEAARLGEKPK